MADHFFKNGLPKRFCRDFFPAKTFGGHSRSAGPGHKSSICCSAMQPNSPAPGMVLESGP
ncbi:MAG: hypothetical protein JXR70_01185 [Spirochaetales bacterium]|nr:hypothetical protein [Spirochaetales bacterium]